MLKQHSQGVLGLLVLADACAVACAWLLSYWIRFISDVAAWIGVDPTKGVPPLGDKFIPMLPLVILAHLLIFYRLRLYRPKRDQTVLGEMRDIVRAFIVATVAIVVVDYAFGDSSKVSRKFVLVYAIVGTTCFALFRGTVRVILRLLRTRGFNRRTAAIVGSGRTAQRLLEALKNNAWTGMETIYFVDDRKPGEPDEVRDLPVYAPLTNLRAILEERPVDSVFVALPTDEADQLDDVLNALELSMADVRLVPEINPHCAMRPDVSTLDDVPILSLRQTPLYGWSAIVKRAFDLGVGAVCLMIAAAPMLAIACAIKLTSAGPVLYRQRRMGFDGREFAMCKFRTMRVDAEKDGPVWSKKADDRRTPIGAFLRRTSLDELPNLFNVLAGEMSLVGPRPERPEFIEQFKAEIPKYMLRHKMKAGMTGFAQIRGYRGETSLKKRIQHDVHYIRHWSLMLDVRILLATVFGVWFSRHES